MSEQCPFAADIRGSVELDPGDPGFSYVPQSCVGCLELPLRNAAESIPQEYLEELEEDCMDFMSDSATATTVFAWARNADSTITVTRESRQVWMRGDEEVSIEYHSRRTAKIVCEKEVQLALWVDEC